MMVAGRRWGLYLATDVTGATQNISTAPRWWAARWVMKLFPSMGTWVKRLAAKCSLDAIIVHVQCEFILIPLMYWQCLFLTIWILSVNWWRSTAATLQAGEAEEPRQPQSSSSYMVANLLKAAFYSIYHRHRQVPCHPEPLNQSRRPSCRKSIDLPFLARDWNVVNVWKSEYLEMIFHLTRAWWYIHH